MKKLLLTALVLSLLALALVACGRGNGGTQQDPPQVAPTPTPAAPATPAPADNDNDEDENGDEDAPAVRTRAEILASLEGWPAPTGYIINAHATRPESNMLSAAWSNAMPNSHARTLMFGGLSTMSRNMGNQFFPNPMVNVGGAWPEVRDNPDGTRTFTFTVYTENQFSDGTFITAANYAADPAFFTSYQWANTVPAAFAWLELDQRTAWINGHIDVLPSVRLYSDSQFSVTFDARFVPNVNEAATQMNFAAVPIHMYGAEIHDNGEGVFLTAIGGGPFTVEGLRQTVYGDVAAYETDEDGEYVLDADGERIPIGDGIKYRPTVFAGPYMFESVDVGNGVLTLVANPFFPGTWDGYRPRIERVIWRLTPSALMVDAVSSGVACIAESIQDGVALENAFEVLVGGGTHSFVNYDQFGQLFTQFHVDTGPTQFREVRQAIAFLQDRHEMNEIVGRGFAVVAHGPWAPAWWWYQEAADRGLYDRIHIYDLNIARAIELLEEGGWNYNADGSPFVQGEDTLRHKWVDEWHWGTDDDGNIIRVLADEDGNLLRSNKVYTGERVLMPLIINWMVRAVPYAFRDALELQLFDNLAYVGGELIQERSDRWSPALTGGYREAERFEMHTLGIGMGNPWAPWLGVSLDAIPAQNWHQVDCPVTRELADRFRTMSILTEEGRDEFVEHFITYMEHLTYELFTLPFNMALVHDFFPHDVQNWNNTGVWGWPEVVQRLYRTR